METPNTTQNEASLVLWNREKLHLQGIEDVISFDELAIYLITKDGKLLIEGNDLHITMLDVSEGNMMIDGCIRAITYNDKDPNIKSGFFAKMFKCQISFMILFI